MKKSLEFTILIIIFTAITVLFFKDVIFSNEILSFRDLGRFFYPPREYAFNLIKQGTIPFWNPFIYCGNPLLASHQSAVFYPVSIIYLFGDFAKAFNNFIYVHFILAGLFMHIFLREQKISGTGSFIGALTFAFSGYMLAAVNVLTFFSSGIWLPLVLWAYFRAVDRASYAYSLLSALFLTAMFLAGEPMVFYMTSVILVASSFRRMKIFFATFILFFALSAFQVLPVIELLVGSDRLNMSYAIATKWSMAPYNFLNLLFPCVTDIEGAVKDYWDKQSWLLDYYLGLFPIIILPVAVFFAKGKRKALAVSILVVSAVLSLGRSIPIYHILFKYLPGFKFFRYPVKYFYLTTFSLAWLSAVGYDFYGKNAHSDRRIVNLAKSSLYIALIASLMLLFIDIFFGECVKFFHDNFFSKSEALPFVNLSIFSIRRSLIFFLVFVLLLFAGTKKMISARMVSFAVIAVILADLYYAAFDINYSLPVEKFKKPSSNIEFLMKDESLFRVISSPSNIYMMFHPTKEVYKDVLEVGKERLCANRMMEYGIYDVGGYEAASPRRILDMVSFLEIGIKDPDQTRLLDVLNVKYIASPKALDLKNYKLVKKSDVANIYENLNVLPRAILSDSAVIIKDKRKIFEKFMDADWNPKKEVILEGEPVLAVGCQLSAVSLKEDAAITKYAPNEVVISAAVNSPKFLVLSDSYYPGWKVYIDGKADKIYAANYISRAVFLPAGRHIIKFVFDPFLFKLGLIVSGLTLMIILIYIVYKKK